MAEGQPLDEQRQWDKEEGSTDHSHHANLGCHCIVEHCSMAQWVADGYVTVKGHGQQDGGLNS